MHTITYSVSPILKIFYINTNLIKLRINEYLFTRERLSEINHIFHLTIIILATIGCRTVLRKVDGYL